MMNRQNLKQCAHADINTCNPRDLVDLQNVTIDTTLPVSQRISQFLDQVHNPYLFKVDGVVVKVNYSGGKWLSSTLAGLLIPQ